MKAHHYTPQSIAEGAVMITFAFLAFSLMLALAKYASDQLPTAMVVFFQNLVCLVVTFPIVLQNGWHKFRTRHPWRHAIRAITGLATYLLLYIALRYVPLADGTLLNSSAPLWVPLLSLIFVREHIPGKAWWGIALGFVGIVLALEPGTGLFDPWSLLALLSGITMASTMVAMKALGRTESHYLIVFYYALFSCLATAPFVIGEWTTPTRMTALALLIIGLLFISLQILIIAALRRGPAGVLSPLSFLAVIFAGILDWIIWHHVPNPIWYIGALLVILGGSWTVLVGRSKYSITK